MRRKQPRTVSVPVPPQGSIERRFLSSILWVGVIPMTLALIIGYGFAREGQWIATQQNQSTAARKTAQGVWLALEGRQLMTARVALDSNIVAGLQAYQNGLDDYAVMLMRRLEAEAAISGDFDPIFSIYDTKGKLVCQTRDIDESHLDTQEWHLTVPAARYIDFRLLEEELRYVTVIAAPVKDPETGELLGFLAETMGVFSLVQFALGHDPEGLASKDNDTEYAIAFLGSTWEAAFYLDDQSPDGRVQLREDPVDPRLKTRLLRNTGQDNDSFFLWRYASRGLKRPVLMAYHRMYPGGNLFIVVYRPVSSVFSNINLGAVLTLLVTSVVIGIFCVIGYRIVNNNIIRPVSLLNEGAQIIRQGDFDLKLRIETGDEIEELAESFNDMAAALRANIKQLEQSEERYRSLITSMRDGIYQTDPDGIVTFMNPAGVSIFGFESTEEAIGFSFRDAFVQRTDFTRVASELQRKGFVEHTRVWIRTRGGRTICLELSANTIRGQERPNPGIEGTFRDVTQNVRLEQEARERSERISAINQISNAINSSLEAGRVYESIVAEIRKLVSFDYASVALLTEANTDSPQETPRFESYQLFPEPPEGENAALEGPGPEKCAEWIAGEGRPVIIDDIRVAEAPLKAAFPPDIRATLCVPLHALGRIIGTLNFGSSRPGDFARHELEVIEELTPHLAVAIRNARLLENLQRSLEEVTRAREKLHDANEELKTLDEMKTNLLSNVSHELRTPLVAVMGYTDMILHGKVGPVNEMQTEYLGISLRNIEKLVTLIENLLDFSRLHRGAEEMVFDTLDLVDCVRMSIQNVQPVADAREINLILNAPAEPVLVEGDKGKLGQVCNNLLSNAVKFNDNGGRVTVDIRLSEDNVEVTVTDTGIGIPPEALDKIFTRFYQYDGSSTRKYGGTGIGLSIAQDIMRLHGSRITVSSEVGKGSSFRFILPLSSVHRTQSEGEHHELPLPTETHLLIELVTQDRALSTQVRHLLLSEGMDVIHASYPAVAISLANKYSPDCILLDTEAGPLGSVVIDEILADPSAGAIPIVLLTNDDALYQENRKRVAGRVKRGFRKSTLLSGIHYALSKGISETPALGNRILCVDDDPEVLRFIERCLETEGYETDSCETGEKALECIESGEYWLVLLDIAMPGIDGWEVCRRIKSNPATAGLKIYMVTAKPIDRGMARVNESGADGYLLKPFKAEDLLSMVQGFWQAERNGGGQMIEESEPDETPPDGDDGSHAGQA